MVRGSIRLSVGGVRRTYREGDIAFIPAHAEHGFVTLEPSTIDVFRPEATTTYIVVNDNPGSDREVAVIETVPAPRRATRYAPSPDSSEVYAPAYTMA